MNNNNKKPDILIGLFWWEGRDPVGEAQKRGRIEGKYKKIR